MSALEDACRAIEQEQEERRLDNEASAARIAELEAQLKERIRLVIGLEGGIIQSINAQGPTDNVEVWVIDADASDGDAVPGEDDAYEHPDGGVVWAYKQSTFDMVPENEQEWLDSIDA